MLTDQHVVGKTELVTPDELRAEFPLTREADATAQRGLLDIRNVIRRQDNRLMVALGPCSIHLVPMRNRSDSMKPILSYAERLAQLANQLSDRLIIVLRGFLEKPRTGPGWEGLLNDPHMDGSFDMDEGARLARQLLIAINELGLPVVTEVIDPIIHAHLDDVVSMAVIGARTSASSLHRGLSSALTASVGIKNDEHGDIEIAINGMETIGAPHGVRGTTGGGRISGIKSMGNPDTMLVLRGGKSGPNYQTEHVKAASERLRQRKLPSRVMIDCSHSNSGKSWERQVEVWQEIIGQLADTRGDLGGIMIESHTKAGRQPFELHKDDPKTLDPDLSATDECIGWNQTAELLRATYEAWTTG